MSERGWVTECQDCPTTLGDYGEQIKVHQEFAPSAECNAEMWAFLHRDQHPGHKVDVKWFERISVKVPARLMTQRRFISERNTS